MNYIFNETFSEQRLQPCDVQVIQTTTLMGRNWRQNVGTIKTVRSSTECCKLSKYE